VCRRAFPPILSVKEGTFACLLKKWQRLTRRNIVTIPFGQTEITLEWGKLAKQANGAVTARVGDAVVLVAVVASETADETKDFFPLLVDYREKFSASGRTRADSLQREEAALRQRNPACAAHRPGHSPHVPQKDT
jgi:hypothetical protein